MQLSELLLHGEKKHILSCRNGIRKDNYAVCAYNVNGPLYFIYSNAGLYNLPHLQHRLGIDGICTQFFALEFFKGFLIEA